MFSDPLSITIGSNPGAVTLARTASGDSVGSFADYGKGLYAKISHRYVKNRAQRMFRVDRRVLGNSELIGGDSDALTYSAWVACDVPQYFLGDDAALDITAQKELVLGLFGTLEASTNAGLIKFLNGEA